jgi:hypothetical protein
VPNQNLLTLGFGKIVEVKSKFKALKGHECKCVETGLTSRASQIL